MRPFTLLLAVAAALSSFSALTEAQLYTFNFESPTVPSNPGYVYNPSVTASQPWTFTAQQSGQGGSGIAAKGSPWDGPTSTPPSGSQYAFLQTYAGYPKTITTALTGLPTTGKLSLSFYVSAREGENGPQTANQLNVQVFGNTIYTITPVSSVSNPNGRTGAWTQHTVTFPANTASTTLAFYTTQPQNAAGDYAVLIDLVVLSTA